MTSLLSMSEAITFTACMGVSEYFISRGVGEPNPFEKAALLTIFMGFIYLSGEGIKYQADGNLCQPLSQFLLASTYVLAVPFTIFAGQVFKFKEAYNFFNFFEWSLLQIGLCFVKSLVMSSDVKPPHHFFPINDNFNFGHSSLC